MVEGDTKVRKGRRGWIKDYMVCMEKELGTQTHKVTLSGLTHTARRSGITGIL